MPYDEIKYDVADRIATITLNRPDKLNAVTATLATEMRDAMIKAGQDANVRVIILTGAGRGFCAGADMGRLSGIQAGSVDTSLIAKPEAELPFPARADFKTRYGYFPAIPKPIIGAINGPCAGLGMVLALYCDLRFAAEDAVFATAFAQRGLIAEYGMAWLLPALTGPAAAMDLLASARRVRADEALRLGLVNAVYPTAELMARTREYARTMATTVSPRSTAIMKRQVWEAMHQPLKDAVALAEDEMRKSFTAEDFKEGVAHYVEKRAPRFTGR
jgi:enoyl-CoA hydratase/carnithine racemase